MTEPTARNLSDPPGSMYGNQPDFVIKLRADTNEAKAQIMALAEEAKKLTSVVRKNQPRPAIPILEMAQSASRWAVVAAGAWIAGHSHEMAGMGAHESMGGLTALVGLGLSFMSRFQAAAQKLLPGIQRLEGAVETAAPLLSPAAMQQLHVQGLEQRLQQAEEALKRMINQQMVAQIPAAPKPESSPSEPVLPPGIPLTGPNAPAVPHPLVEKPTVTPAAT